ncbi:MAG: hypothetical protein ACMG57_02100 [Candidatus Dojkabacteria bacterium]
MDSEPKLKVYSELSEPEQLLAIITASTGPIPLGSLSGFLKREITEANIQSLIDEGIVTSFIVNGQKSYWTAVVPRTLWEPELEDSQGNRSTWEHRFESSMANGDKELKRKQDVQELVNKNLSEMGIDYTSVFDFMSNDMIDSMGEGFWGDT